MEETFILPVNYKGTLIELPCTFRKLGYTYKISTWIKDQEFLFEPDEEGSFRVAVANIEESRTGIDRLFLKEITDQLTHYLK